MKKITKIRIFRESAIVIARLRAAEAINRLECSLGILCSLIATLAPLARNDKMFRLRLNMTNGGAVLTAHINVCD
ncbi:MAG: hypothetical protein K2N20_06765 [Helicobacter sp.]|nr:hypothetical protein [Helicobacter sp.]